MRWGGWLWGGDSVETVQQGHCQSRINMESELCPHAHSQSGDQGHRVKETIQWWDNGMQCGCVPCAQVKYVSPFLCHVILRQGSLLHYCANAAYVGWTSDTWCMSLHGNGCHSDDLTQGHHIWNFKCLKWQFCDVEFQCQFQSVFNALIQPLRVVFVNA